MAKPRTPDQKSGKKPAGKPGAKAARPGGSWLGRHRGLTAIALAVVALAAALVHPVSLAVGRARGKDGTLDGLAWMSREAPGDRAAIEWLRKGTPPSSRLLEVSGGAYSDHGRIGTFSGRPTFLAWAGHEGLWRGDAGGEEVSRRQAELKTVYTSTDLAAVREILARRGIRYVVTGPLERKEFGPDAFPLRESFKVAFQSRGTELREAAP